MEEVERLAHDHRPKADRRRLVGVPRHLDFAAFREIADSVDAKLMVDMATSPAWSQRASTRARPPRPRVTTTIHKTLCGPRSGMILCKEELAAEVNRAVFPGQQGGPLMHIIAAKGGCVESPSRRRQGPPAPDRRQCARLRRGADGGRSRRLTDGTDVHLVLVGPHAHGARRQDRGGAPGGVRITVNRNAIPFDERPPMNPSACRIGTPALTTRGLVEADLREVADVVSEPSRTGSRTRKSALRSGRTR